MKAKDVLWSKDLCVALVLFLALAAILPHELADEFCKDAYNIGITVLSIVFSMYLAALALIMSSSDDHFVSFLEKKGLFSKLTAFLTYSLVILFVALLIGLTLYLWTAFRVASVGVTVAGTHTLRTGTQPWWLFASFVAFFLYSLASALGSMMDSIKYSKRRATFLRMQESKQKEFGIGGTGQDGSR